MADAYLTIGGPGAGKTTFIAHEVERAMDSGYRPHEIDVRSLTRTAAKQASGQLNLPPECVGTLHSAAFRALGLTRDDVAESKIASFNEAAAFPISGEKVDLDDAAPIERKINGKGQGDLLHARMNVLRAQRVPRDQWDESTASHADEWFSWMAREGLVDFPGMLERALEDTYAMPGKPGVMFVDEVQDVPKLGLDLIVSWGKHADKLILVGDPCQCLYQWAGSDPRALASAIALENRRMLKRSHRVPRAGWAWASEVARSQIDEWGMAEFSPRDEQGCVGPWLGSSKTPEHFLGDVERDLASGRSVMILATCSYMLAPSLAVLRRLAVPFSNPWRPTRGDWNPLAPSRVRKLLDFVEGKQNDIADMGWLKDLSIKVLSRGTKTRLIKGLVETPRDFVSWCSLFSEEAHAIKALGERSLDWLEANLDGSKARSWEYPLAVLRTGGVKALRERPRLHAGTVHSVKGGEADVVYLFQDVSPHAAEDMMINGREAMARVFFVAATRARHEVRLCAAPAGVPRFRW